MVQREPSIDVLLGHFESIAFIRACEEIVIRHYPSNEMKTPVHLAVGAEAIAVGVLSVFSDIEIFGSYRNHHWYLAKTKDGLSFFKELLLKKSAPTGGRAGSMHLMHPQKDVILTSAVVASTLSVAMGSAWARKSQGSKKGTLVFCGDGALEEGTFFETINFCKLKSIPLLFVVEDNALAIHSPKQVRQAFNLKEVCQSFQVPYFEGNGASLSEVIQKSEAAKQSITSGPAVLHLHYHRQLEHVGIGEDYEAGYRNRPSNLEPADPLAITKKELEHLGASTTQIEAALQSASKTAEAAFKSAIDEPLTNSKDAHLKVFAEGT